MKQKDDVLDTQHDCELGITFILKREENELVFFDGLVTVQFRAQLCATPVLVLSASVGLDGTTFKSAGSQRY